MFLEDLYLPCHVLRPRTPISTSILTGSKVPTPSQFPVVTGVTPSFSIRPPGSLVTPPSRLETKRLIKTFFRWTSCTEGSRLSCVGSGSKVSLFVCRFSFD